MDKKVSSFKLFQEAMGIEDLSSIPGKGEGERNYLSDVTRRAQERLGLRGEFEGRVGQQLMQAFGQSLNLSRGYERQLEELATQVITDLYKPLIDHYNIKLDIKIASGPEIKRMLDAGFAKQKSTIQNQPSQTPIVRARGADFSMLIHEAVKGIWRVLSMGSVPTDPQLARAVESQFGLRDEPEDWKYGPEIAADLRDFINENPKVDLFQNVREEVWKEMVDERKIPTQEFLDLMKGILSKTQEARRKIDSIIDNVIKKLESREKYKRDLEEYERQMKEYERQMEEYNKKMQQFKQKGGMISLAPTSKETEELDYSKMSKRELDAELSKALDAKDFEKAKIISDYL